MTLRDLEGLKNVDLNKVDRNMVTDIDDIIINQNKPKEERFKEYFEMTRNPYLVKCGDTLIKMSFADTDVLLEECIKRYLIECLNDSL